MKDFVDSTVRVYRADTGDLIRTEEPFPEGGGPKFNISKEGIKKMTGRKPRQAPEDLAEQWEAQSYKIDRLAKHYHAGWGTIKIWLLEAGLLDSPEQQEDLPVCGQCGRRIAGTAFDHGAGPRCFDCVMGGQTVTAPIGVEVPNYEPEDNDFCEPEEAPILLGPVSDYIAEHHQVAEEIAALLDSKRADYGVENIRKFGSRGCMVRASDKIERLINLTWVGGSIPKHEAIEDTWLDLVGYGLLGLIELRAGR